MPNELNQKGYMHALELIRQGKVDASSPWSISAEEENAILGDPPDWDEYALWHLGRKPDADEETKAAWVYPFGKGGKVYRSALTAIRQRAGQQDDTEIFEAAGRLIEKIDEEAEDSKKAAGSSMRVTNMMRFAAAADGGEPGGWKWRVMVAEYGLSKDGLIFWAEDALRAAAPLYEGARVFALQEAQHQGWPHPYGKSVREMVGWIENVTATETGLEADLQILRTAGWLRDMLADAVSRGKPDLIGLSHDVAARASAKNVGGREVWYIEEIVSVTVDVVYEPAAGGKFIRMAAALAGQKEEKMNWMKLLAALKERRPDLKAEIEAIEAKGDEVTEDEVMTLMATAMSGPDLGEQIRAAVLETISGLAGNTRADEAGGGQEPDPMNEVRLIACRLTLREELAGSGLPGPVVEKLQKQYEGRVFEVEDLRAAIRAEKEVIEKLTASGAVEGSGELRLLSGERDNVDRLLDDFFDRKFHSFRAAYVRITGDERITGQVRAASRLRASIQTSTFAEVLGDAVTRKMLKEYNAAGLDDWRKIVDIVPADDFRTQHRPRIGGYGDLPTVAQGDAYTALTSPTDEESTYAPTKRGGTEDITIEAIKNDDVGAIRNIPRKLARAAKRTLYKFVFDFLKDNPTIYDATSLFTAGHGNLGTAALDATSLAARRLAMIKQTEMDSGEQIGIPPKFVVVPPDLQKTAEDLVIPPSSGQYMPTSPDFLKRQIWDVITVLYWTDANNWYLVADPADIPTIELAFLDGNEEPEIFVQDMPNVGSMFSNDKLTYKIRHIYGGAVMDYRGFQGSIVA